MSWLKQLTKGSYVVVVKPATSGWPETRGFGVVEKILGNTVVVKCFRPPATTLKFSSTTGFEPWKKYLDESLRLEELTPESFVAVKQEVAYRNLIRRMCRIQGGALKTPALTKMTELCDYLEGNQYEGIG